MELKYSGLPTSLQKALRLLYALTPFNRPMRLLDLTQAAGLTRSSGHRLAVGMADAGLLEYDREEGTYSLGLGILDLAWVLLETSPLRRAALPHMMRLCQSTGTHVSLAIPSQVQMVILERLWSYGRSFPETTQVQWLIGARLPMLYSAHGRAYLAYLDPDERDRYIRRASGPFGQIGPSSSTIPPWTPPNPMSRGELIQELRRTRDRQIGQQDSELAGPARAIASPIFGRGKRPVGTLAMLWFEPEISVCEVIEEAGPALLEAAQRTSTALLAAPDPR